MRIKNLQILNYRGIRRAEIVDADESGVITISGPNGSGKSLLLEAIANVWNPQVRDPASAIGPWANQASIMIEFSLNVAEMAAAKTFGEENQMPVDDDITPSLAFEISEAHGVRFAEPHNWRRILRNDAFRRKHRFSEIDFLPADRTIRRGEQAHVNPALLGLEQSEQFRQQVSSSYLLNRQIVELTGIQPFLASLDYLELIADRQEIEAPKDFETITSAFASATGKTIDRPLLDEAFGASLKVRTPAGAEHGVDELSSGEQEVLGLMYFVRRLSAQGGILLIDEPELHLHPALQRSLFSIIEAVAQRAHVWISTHSARLVTAAPLQSILHMRPAAQEDTNQISPASAEPDRMTLLDELGMHPIDILQSEFVLVVEGTTDERNLSTLLPILVGRSAVYVAGSGDEVVRAGSVLHGAGQVLPWVGVRDRDLLSDEEVAELESKLPSLFVWPSRMLENELLSPQLLEATLARAGSSLTADAIANELQQLAEEDFDRLVAHLVEKELVRKYSLKPDKTGDPIEDLKRHLETLSESARERHRAVDQTVEAVRANTEERWPDEWPQLMHGKRVLAQFLPKTPFRSLGDLVGAIAQTLAEDESLMPGGLAALKSRIEALSRH